MSDDLEEITPAGSAAPVYVDTTPEPPPTPPEVEPPVDVARRRAYQASSDPLFFKWQRGDEGVTEQDWLDAIQAVKDQYPK